MKRVGSIFQNSKLVSTLNKDTWLQNRVGIYDNAFYELIASLLVLIYANVDCFHSWKGLAYIRLNSDSDSYFMTISAKRLQVF